MNKTEIKQIILEEIEAALEEMNMSPEMMAADSRPEEDDFAFDKMDGEMYDDAGDPMEAVNEDLRGLMAQGEKMAAFANKQSGYEGGVSSPVRGVLAAMAAAGAPDFDGDEDLKAYWTRQLTKAIKTQMGRKYMSGLNENIQQYIDREDDISDIRGKKAGEDYKTIRIDFNKPMFGDLKNAVGSYARKKYGDNIELDWRDSQEVEIDINRDLNEMARTSNIFKLKDGAGLKDVLQFMQRVNDVLKTYKSPGQKRPKKRFTLEEMKALAKAMLKPEGFTSKDVIAATSYTSPAQANKFLAALEQKGLITITSILKKSLVPDRDPNAPETRGRKAQSAEFDIADDPTGMDFSDFDNLDLSDPTSLYEEGLLNFEGDDMYLEIKGDMKRYYKMDVPMDVIKDWADDYFPNRYDDKDDYEFETSAREDFLDHLEDEFASGDSKPEWWNLDLSDPTALYEGENMSHRLLLKRRGSSTISVGSYPSEEKAQKEADSLQKIARTGENYIVVKNEVGELAKHGFEVPAYQRKRMQKELKEEEFKLYTTNVEYDNGETGYMYQLVNSEDREENEIGFDQLFFDDKDNRLKMGVDFKDFDQGSYQDEEVSAEEAMKIYKSLAENKLVKEDKSLEGLKKAKPGTTVTVGKDKYVKKAENNMTVNQPTKHLWWQKNKEDKLVHSNELAKLIAKNKELKENNNMSNNLTNYIKKVINEAKNPLAAKLKEVEAQGRIASLESKLAAIQEMIEETNSRLTRIDEDNEFSEMMDKKAVKDVRKQLKELERAEAKLQKEYDKVSGGRKKETVVDEDYDEDSLDNAVDEVEIEEDNMRFEGLNGVHDLKPMVTMNESLLRMQKLAGLITEGEFAKKKQRLNEGDAKQMSDGTKFSMYAGNVFLQKGENTGAIIQYNSNTGDAIIQDDKSGDSIDIKVFPQEFHKKLGLNSEEDVQNKFRQLVGRETTDGNGIFKK